MVPLKDFMGKVLDMPKNAPSAALPRDARALIGRIEKLMTENHTNAAAISRKAGLGDTAVYDIITGKNKNPSLPVVKAIAKALNCTVAYLVGEQSERDGQPVSVVAIPIPIIGIAETGAFRAMADFDQDDQRKLPKIDAAKSSDYPRARHFALRIRGDSMNQAKPYPLLDGVLALCVDTVDAGLEVESGRIYAVRRTLDGGQTYECTVKRAKVFRDRFEFHPESSNPEHKPLIIKRGDGRDDTTKEIGIIGLVYGIHFDGKV
jgi:SOS-response transcriptional repressor LexA